MSEQGRVRSWPCLHANVTCNHPGCRDYDDDLARPNDQGGSHE